MRDQGWATAGADDAPVPAAALKPAEGNAGAVDEALDSASDDELRAQRERLEVDQELRNVMAMAGFKGPNYDRWREDMARYALSITTAWIVGGQMFTLLRSHGLGTPMGDGALARLRGDRDELESVANEIVARTFVFFRKHALENEKWTSEGGASLATFFMGASLWAAANVLKAWRKADARSAGVIAGEVPEVEDQHAEARVELTVIGSMNADALRARFPAEVGQVLGYLAAGYSSAEVAELTNRTPRSIEGLIYRARTSAGPDYPDRHVRGNRR